MPRPSETVEKLGLRRLPTGEMHCPWCNGLGRHESGCEMGALLRAAVRMRREVPAFTSADYATPEVRAAKGWDRAVAALLGGK